MHPDIEKFKQQIETLIGFIEGKVDGFTLDAAIATTEMQELLQMFKNEKYPASSNHLYRLQNKLDRATLCGLVNSEGIIEDFLKKLGVSFKPVMPYRKLYSLILKSLPEYLDPPLEYLMGKVIPKDEKLSEAKIVKIIKEKLAEQFKYAGKPPKWIQSAEWPIVDGKPLTFIGQIAINAPELFHDNGAVYVFYDETTGSFETLSQFS